MLGYPIFALRQFFYRISRLTARWRKPPDYVVFQLGGEYSDYKQPAPNFVLRRLRPESDSLLDYSIRFQRIAMEPRVKGVLFLLRPLRMSQAQIETLRQQILLLKEAGKRVVFWSYTYDTSMYFLASIADEILMLPSGQMEGLGLRSTYPFLADALQQIGIRADFIPISPYKTAGDIFTNSAMSDEMRQMTNWLLDDLFEQILGAVQSGRNFADLAETKRAFDLTPCTDLEALEAGLIDNLVVQEDLPTHLGSEVTPTNLAEWKRCQRTIQKLPPVPPAKSVALIPIEGMIFDGRSARPPIKPPFDIPILADSRAGDLDIVQSARKALSDPGVAAAVVYVNSPGGSATASKKIHSALSALQEAKPVVVCMGSTAASGGYYVSALGKEIFAQPSTITGSIGVVLGKIVLKDLLDRLSIGRETLTRGEGVTIYDAEKPFSDREREKLLHQIQRIYDVFLQVIVEAREIPREELIEKSEGKVWTGRQALQNNLIDHLGGLEDAISHAGKLAGLPDWPRVQVILPEKEWIPPSNPVPALAFHMIENWRFIQDQRILLLSPFSHGIHPSRSS